MFSIAICVVDSCRIYYVYGDLLNARIVCTFVTGATIRAMTTSAAPVVAAAHER